MSRAWTAWVGWALLAAALGLVLCWPVVRVVHGASFESAGAFGFPNAMHVARPMSLALQTLTLVALTELLAVPLGVALAFLLYRTDMPGRIWLRMVVVLGLFLPLPLQALAWLGSFGNLGRMQAIGSAPVLVGLFGAAFVHALAVLPWVVLIVGAGVRSVEPELEELASLEWPAWREAFGVTLRRSVGAIGAAALAVAVLTAGDMTVTDLIPLRTYAEEAYTLSQLGLGLDALVIRTTMPQALILGVLVAVMSMVLFWIDPARLALVASPRRDLPLRGVRWPLAIAVWVGAAAAVGLPLYGLIWRAGRVGPGLVAGMGATWSFAGFWGTIERAWADLMDPGVALVETHLIGTLLWAGLGATGAVALGWSLACAARGSIVWRVAAVFAIVVSLATPGPVAGLAMKLAYVRVRWLCDTPALLVLTYIARTLPYVIVILWTAARLVPRDWFDLAAVEGLGPWRQVVHVLVPATWPAACVAWLLALAMALGELPASNVVYAPGYEPLSLLIWNLLHVGVESRLAGIGLIVLGIVGAVGLVSSFVMRRWLAKSISS